MVGAIWAQSVDRIIGNGAGMPWHLPEDLKPVSYTHLTLPTKA